ncbi:MAG TPA: TolC family protein [Thermoanaerobaculia bacterium]|nr:TolC family protein [Thermoanaerobaculia bacterium]
MFAKTALALILIVFGLGAAPSDEPFAGAPRLDRRALLAAVARRNPTLEAARLAWQAAAARPPLERALPDPMLSYGVAPGSIAGGGRRFGQQIELSQDLPLPGRRRLRAEQAAARARGAAADYREALLDLLTTASRLYDDDWLVERSLAIVGQHRALLAELQRVAAGRYAAGLVPQQDPIQAELEGAKMLHRQVELEAEREAITTRLAALLHLPADHPLPPPSPAEAPAVEAGPEAAAPARAAPAVGGTPAAAPPAGVMSAAALAERPEVAARAAEVEAQRAAVALARLAGTPDLALRGSYDSMWDAPGYRWTAGIAVNLPVRRERLAGQRAEAEARLARARAELAAAEDRIRAEGRTAVIAVDEAGHLQTIFESRLLPAARDQVQAARSGFETGRGSFLGMIDAERSLRDVELGREQAVADLHRKQAELDRALGRLPAGLPPELLDPAAARAAAASPPAPAATREGGPR